MILSRPTYRVALLCPDRSLSAAIVRAIEGDYCHVACYTTANELYATVRYVDVDLLIIAVAHYSPEDNTLYRTVERLHALGLDIFVITNHHSVRHTMHLLAGGVRQCMTLPLSVERLRRKVYAHLSTKVRHRESIC